MCEMHMASSRKQILATRLNRVADEAEELFAREGFLQFSTTEIAKRLRCSKTTIYSIAPSREKFFELIALRRLIRINQKWIEAADGATDCVTAIRAFVEASVKTFGECSNRFLTDLQSFPGGLRAIRKSEADRLQLLEGIIAEGVKAGVFRRLDPKLTAMAWTAASTRVTQPEFLSTSSFTHSQALRQLHGFFSQGLLSSRNSRNSNDARKRRASATATRRVRT
jgi:AcrR family transcriptional regulator